MKKLSKREIRMIIEETDMPKKTKFKGFVLNLIDDDEYLAHFKNIKSEMISYVWAKTPEMALVFKDQKRAEKTLKDCDKENLLLCLMFDIGKQLVIVKKSDCDEIIEDYNSA